MKVLIGSPAFPPSLGGLERFVEQLATGLAEGGDQVTVLTATPSARADDYPFRVVRLPGPIEKLRLFRECDVFFQANVSLKDLWPRFLVRRPWVISHHGPYEGQGVRRVLARLKTKLAKSADERISVSGYVASRVDPSSRVIPNPYRDDLFREIPGVERDRDFVFVGRLVSDKGCDLLLRAMAEAVAEAPELRLTIVGEGPEEPRLKAQTRELSLGASVEFRGRLEGEDLARELNRHRVLVVPSLWAEPFGIVALEGIACGCVVAAARAGGLPEAVGACGVLFEPGRVAALAEIMSRLATVADLERYRAGAAQHLERHRGSLIVGRYREALRRAAGDPATC